VEFDRCVIIGTTNAGHREVQRRLKEGPAPSDSELTALYEAGVERQFDAPLLRRFDLKLTFSHLSEAERIQVAKLYLERAIQEHCPAELTIDWSEGYLTQLTAGCDSTLGAGELKNHVEAELKRALIEGYFERERRPSQLTLGQPCSSKGVIYA
jgi:ATP-dependent Clp protease ATP-binding subunit ClpA